MKIRLSLHRTAWFSYYFWLECGRKQLALGPRVDSGGFRQCWRGTGGGWCNCSLPSRTVASFCPACFRGTKREVVLGEGQMQMGQEGGHRRCKSQSTKPVFQSPTSMCLVYAPLLSGLGTQLFFTWPLEKPSCTWSDLGG